MSIPSCSVYEKNIPELTQAMQNHNLTALELTTYYLRRIQIYDGCLNSMITVNSQALPTAQILDNMRTQGIILGPLHGIPIILKDNYDTFDMPTTSGAKAFVRLQPQRDAFTVQKLRQAGAIILGKSNLTEMACGGMTVSSVAGQTLNPYDLTRTPGGSSGGTGAAIAANFAAAGTGTDTINSIRSPASANNLVGLRPTRGLISRNGLVPCSSYLDQAGPISRSVVDAAIMLKVMAGYDPEDKSTELIKDVAIPDYPARIRRDGLNDKKIVLLKNILGQDPEVRKIIFEAVADCQRLGATIIEMDIPELYVPALLEHNNTQRWEQKFELDRYLKALSPHAPVRDVSEYVASGLLHASMASDMAIYAAEEDGASNPEYHSRLHKNQELRTFIERLMNKEGIDAFLYPLQTILVVQTNDIRGQAGRNGFMAAAAGLPAITLPAGFSSPTDTAPQGVPIGIELMGRPFAESELLSMGYAYEQATRHRQPPLALPNI